jgi:esterase/lipase
MDGLNKYSFNKENKQSLIFLPGYTGGLETFFIKELISRFTEKKEYDVFAVDIDYKSDIIDSFEKSQEKIKDLISEYKDQHPQKNVCVIAKSLSGSLCLHLFDSLKVSKMIILGFPVVLGWPPRISLLNQDNTKIPNYKKEWREALEKISKPVKILSGEKDDLTDNIFLEEISKENKNIELNVISGVGHDLINNKKEGLFKVTEEVIAHLKKI